MSVWVQGFFILILVVVGFVVGVGLLLCGAGASLDREFRRRHPVLSAIGIMAAVAIVLFILFGMYMSIMHEVFGVV